MPKLLKRGRGDDFARLVWWPAVIKILEHFGADSWRYPALGALRVCEIRFEPFAVLARQLFTKSDLVTSLGILGLGGFDLV